MLKLRGKRETGKKVLVNEREEGISVSGKTVLNSDGYFECRKI